MSMSSASTAAVATRASKPAPGPDSRTAIKPKSFLPSKPELPADPNTMAGGRTSSAQQAPPAEPVALSPGEKLLAIAKATAGSADYVDFMYGITRLINGIMDQQKLSQQLVQQLKDALLVDRASRGCPVY